MAQQTFSRAYTLVGAPGYTGTYMHGICMCILIYTDVATCPAEKDNDYEITWPTVGANMNATIACPNAAGMI